MRSNMHRAYTRRRSHCLFLPPTSFSFSLCLLLKQINSNGVRVFTHQIHYPSHLSQAVTSQVHMLDLLISDASHHLFCRDQSEVTHNCLWETRPAAQQQYCSHDEGIIFLLPSFDFCQADHKKKKKTRSPIRNLRYLRMNSGVNSSFITNINISIHYGSNPRNILLIQNSAHRTLKLSKSWS